MRYRHDVLNMDQATISEIRSYHHPPDGVHPTMIAVYMICGHPEEHLSDWTEVTSLMGKYGKESLLREVDQADTRQVSNRVALRARNYLGMYTLDEVRSVSSGAATFHMWASEKVGQNQRNDDEGETHGNNAQDKNKTQGKNTQPQAKQTQQSKSKQDKNTEANTQQANKAVTKAAKGNKVDPRDTNGKAIKSTKKG